MSGFREIATILRAAIVVGAYAQGEMLASEAGLVAFYQVSRGTVRRALSELEQEGLVCVVPGVGRFVGRRPAAGDKTPPMSKTNALAAELRHSIAVSPAGTRIPGEMTLAEVHGVARVTVRRAIALLAAEGLVSTRQGVGTVVT